MERTQGQDIGRLFADLHHRYYGHGPAGVRTHASEDTVVVVLEETFTQAEMMLIERGEAGEVQVLRRRFQRAVAEEFVAIIEQATGRAVRCFFSDTDLKEAISVEVFILGDRREAMGDFEFGPGESRGGESG